MPSSQTEMKKVTAQRRVVEQTVTVETSGPVFQNDNSADEAVRILDHMDASTAKAIAMIHDTESLTADIVQQQEPVQVKELIPAPTGIDNELQILDELPVGAPSTLFKLPVSPSRDAGGNSIQRRNREISERQVVVIFSNKLKIAHVTTHIGYTNKSRAGAITLARNDLAKQQITRDLAHAHDLDVTVLPEKYSGVDINNAKSLTYKRYQSAGWHMVGQIPRDPVVEGLATKQA
jgi:hypothetical protein